MKEEKELEIKKQEMTPLQVISQAVLAGNVPVETMEKLMNLQERWEANKAKKEFDKSLAQFQSELPTIKKTKTVKNKDGTVRYSYAPLESIIEQTKGLLSKHGFSYRFDTKVNGMIEVTCRLTHESGHSETSFFAVPVDKDAYMTAPQQFASALTFAKRYTFNDIVGIMTADEDNDAQDSKNKEAMLSPETKESIDEIRITLESAGDITELQKKWEWIVTRHPAAAKKLEKLKNELKRKLK
ncbi:MAG: ERF family protein [Patescibacteria group bacterium]|nr:ERF family protein [Patescibacteria group bacterium]MDE2227367.1 ERF family protein [Patescibacteria group bacterium]